MSIDAGAEDIAHHSFISDCTCQVKWSFSSQRHRRSIEHNDTITVSPLVTLFVTMIIGSWTREYVTQIILSNSFIRRDLYVLLTAYKQHIVGIACSVSLKFTNKVLIVQSQ